jgi:RNA polymerase sigma-70 factor (ECF subfamily)
MDQNARPIFREKEPNGLGGVVRSLPEGADGFDQRRIEELIEQARGGAVNALDQLLDACRAYLTMLADRQLDPALRVKFAASDLVQETSLDAFRDFQQFRGRRLEELLAWLRAILLHNVISANRRYQVAEKRSLSREVPLDYQVAIAGDPQADVPSPRSALVVREEEETVRKAIDRLPPAQRSVILLRHKEQLSFAEIGERLDRSMAAAHKLWCRALVRLQRELSCLNVHE